MGQQRKEIALPNRFRPQFWDEQDGRSVVVKEIRNRVAQLEQDCGADSYQKQLLCQHAVFIALQLETAQIDAVHGKPFNAGVYTQMVNCLSGLLAKLGLEKAIPKAIDLKAYVKHKEAKA